MKPIDTDYAIIPFYDSKISAYLFNGDIGSWGGVATDFVLSDGREGVGSPYFGLGLGGLITKLLGGSPKPKLDLSTRHPYVLRSEITDDRTINEIKDLLTLKCAGRDCRKATQYSVRFILCEGLGFSRGRTTNVCFDHVNEFIDDGIKVYSSNWNVIKREFPIHGSRYEEIGRIRV